MTALLSQFFTDRRTWDTQLLQAVFDDELIAPLLFSKIFTMSHLIKVRHIYKKLRSESHIRLLKFYLYFIFLLFFF